jgi:hypothetical protein
MDFRTAIKKNDIDVPNTLITYQSNICLFGSCFVENIGRKLTYYKFDNLLNPFGVLFNPISIEKVLQESVQEKKIKENDLVYDNEMWHSLHHHSDFSNTDKSKTLNQINDSLTKTHAYLKKATHLIVTLGTAWVYYHIESDQLVANCHKIPQKHFKKYLLNIKEIISSLQNIEKLIKSINPDVQLIITLSPVRHLRNGMIEDSRSKAHLLSGIQHFVDKTDAIYFPSYEIVVDDLRDYRFYDSDMLHPNATAINYIWNLYKETTISKEIHKIMDEVNRIQKSSQHKAFNPHSNKYKNFINDLNKKKQELFTKHKIRFD